MAGRAAQDPEQEEEMIGRRQILGTLGGFAVLALTPRPLFAAAPALTEALVATDLIYLTPIRADGTESRCQAELWFASDGTDIYVVTAAAAWRARAVADGLDRARIWVGDLGVWTRTDGRYRNLPQVEASAAFVTDSGEHARVLKLFGSKYPLGWVLWGPRFRRGLANGSRVMLRYQPVASG